MKYSTSLTANTVTADVFHMAERVNKKYRNNLKRKIREQEEFYSKMAERQIILAAALNKLIEKL
jgi:hypothetical protein